MRPKEVLARNLKLLMAARPDLRTLPLITAATHGALSNGKLDRIRRAVAPTDVDSIQLLAEAFGLQAWQLLVEDLDPKRLPVLARPQLLAEIRQLVSANHEADAGGQELPLQGNTDKKPSAAKKKLTTQQVGSGSASGSRGSRKVPKSGSGGSSGGAA